MKTGHLDRVTARHAIVLDCLARAGKPITVMDLRQRLTGKVNRSDVNASVAALILCDRIEMASPRRGSIAATFVPVEEVVDGRSEEAVV